MALRLGFIVYDSMLFQSNSFSYERRVMYEMV